MYMPFMSETPKMFVNGVDTSMYGICLSERPNIPVTNRVQSINTPTYSNRGTERTNTGWEDLEITVSFNYLEEYEKSYKSFRQAFHEIADFLHKADKIVFNDDYDVYYLVKHVNINSAKNDMLEYGEFDVSFTCNPFGYVNDDDMGTEYRFHNYVPAKNPYRSYEILNDGADEAYPKLRLDLFNWTTQQLNETNPLTLELEWKDHPMTLPETRMTWTLEVRKLVVGYNLVIDSEKTLAYWEANSAFEEYRIKQPTLDTITMTNFPTLQVGTSSLNVNKLKPLTRELIINVERNVII